MSKPTGMALFAALSEHIYRRDEVNDQSLKLSDIIDASRPLAINMAGLSASLNLVQGSDGYIYSTGGATSGFSAMVNRIGDQYVITFRGTDSTLSAWSTVFANVWNSIRRLRKIRRI